MTYSIARFLIRLVSRLPLRVLYVVADILYVLAYYVVRYRRRIVRRNLTESFPDKDPAWIRRTERKFYRNFADNIVETIKLATMSREQMRRRMHFTNIDTIDGIISSGRSVALYLGHYGNWEWISSIPLHITTQGATLGQIYHRLRNADMDRIMLEMRGRMGSENIEMYQTARRLTAEAAAGRTCLIGFIADQSPKARESHHFVPFLNHDAATLVGTEKIVRHYGYEPWYVDVRRIRRGYYEATFVPMDNVGMHLEESTEIVGMHPEESTEIVGMHPGASTECEAPDSEKYPLTAQYYRMLEATIRRDPPLYLWTHNRFKHSRPLNH